ncbi:hypothetical protein LTS02_007037 [Friedmanniomyces endolithicus]|nr:hypothetical protein LTR94_003393 [Friedmanniomyces endolithicus]KAK0812919.1 hypothetical protein LTR59_001296 [Friedmanniomyces endolithicus]KAK0820190.1 hypothetical protein LTR38_000098 [Friedmanniomyces endolithicus]KAK0862662.1 hypothetical protein LTS02_007037 [Friedmanniomyces endolithicus]KAK0875750.1 hypothetical protein LTR87_010440 [Friedmanniomyces endolithicus]
MAGYYIPYDSRSQPPRHTDPASRPRNFGTHIEPAAGHASTSHHERVDYARAQRYSYDAHDTRYIYPPRPPPDAGRPGPPPRSPTGRRRHVWPPPPCCEDEAVSLAREAGAEGLLKVLKEAGKDEVQSRGAIDQEPMIEELPEFMNQYERRFVLTSDAEQKGRSRGVPTPPTSEDERSRKLRRKPSRLHTALGDGVPEMARRTASPYVYSRPARLHRDLSSTDHYQSPSTLTPPPTEYGPRRRERFSTSPKVSSPRRESRVSPSTRKGNDYFTSGNGSSDNAILDDEWDASNSAGRRMPSPRAPQTYPPPTTSTQSDAKDNAPDTSSIRRLNLDARRNTDTGSPAPFLPSLRVEKSRRPAPYAATGALGDSSESAVYSAPVTPGGTYPSLPRSRDSSYVSSRGVSPAATNAAANAEPSPPPSARQSRDMSQTYTGSSSPHSGNGSASASRPASPSPRTPGDTARLPRTDLDWSTLLAANAARKAKPPSRLASSMRQDSVPDVHQAPHGAHHASRNSTSLPYPEDFGPSTPTMYMPSERDHLHFPAPRPKLEVPSTSEAKTSSRSASPAASNASRTSNITKPGRPAMPTRHSIANATPIDERPQPAVRRHDSFSTSSQTKRELSALMKKGLPDCQRPESVSGYDDWYTVIGAPGLTFCPGCVDSVFERTIFRPSIRRLPQLNLNNNISCAFGSSPWLRLAWLLTLQQHRTDLTLLRDLADIEATSEPCPGGTEATRSWYGLRDREGYFVKDFHICYSDVRKTERLLPTLSGFFVRLPQRSSHGVYTCGIRAEGNRFSAYLDALIATHERALASRKGPDPMPFVDLVERKTRLRECTRDNMLTGGLWHFMPNIPTLTICEDCYEAVVEPEVRRNSEVAMRFNRTIQPVYGEGMGSSCQLYSRRMRKIFQRAVEDNDLKYLARKSKERREAELRLQERYKDVVRLAKRLSRDAAGGDDERRLNRELDRITQEWQAKWE